MTESETTIFGTKLDSSMVGSGRRFPCTPGMALKRRAEAAADRVARIRALGPRWSELWDWCCSFCNAERMRLGPDGPTSGIGAAASAMLRGFADGGFEKTMPYVSRK